MVNSKEPVIVASDGKPAISLGFWFRDKLYYFKQYCNIFSTGMKNIWEHRVYVDLFSGPGLCIEENSDVEEYGSPIISLNCKTPFTKYYFVDENKSFIEALKYRTQNYKANITYINKDCNHAVDDLINQLPKKSAIFFTFIDPFNYEIEFESIKKLSKHRRMDLLITFHTGSLKRSIHNPSERMKRFFPPLDWNELYTDSYVSGRIHERLLLDKYEEGLEGIGYKYFDDCILTRNVKNAPLYHLIFATKDERGKEFYSKISMRSRTGQSRFI